MQIRRAVGDPAHCHRRGVGAEYRFLRIVALLESDAFAVAQIDRGVDLHSVDSYCHLPFSARADVSECRRRCINASAKRPAAHHSTNFRNIASPTVWLFSG